MKPQLIFLFSLALLIFSCDKEVDNFIADNGNAHSDSLFVESFLDDNSAKTVERIDKMLAGSKFSDHRTAILYMYKGRGLGKQTKDIEAIGSLEKALTLFVPGEDDKNIAVTCKNLGDSYAYLGEKDKSLESINKALEFYRDLEDVKNESYTLNSLAHAWFLFEDVALAIQFIKQAAKIQSDMGYHDDLSATYNNLGLVYENISLIDTAEVYYVKALDINRKYNLLTSITQRNLAGFYTDYNKFDQAKELFFEALKLEENNEILPFQKEIYDGLLKIALLEKDFEEAMNLSEKRDSVLTLKNEMESRNKMKLVKSEYELLTRDKELEKVKAINFKNQIIFVIVAVALLLGSLFLYQRNKSAKLELIQDKLILEQDVLRSQMNPHFIFNALSAIQNSLMENEPMKTATYLSRFAKLIRQNFDFVKRKSILLSEELDSLRNYMDTQKLRFSDRFDYTITIDDSIDEFETTIPPLLLQPFIENAIEHGFKGIKEKGLLEIDVTRKDENICYQIKDNGQGYKSGYSDGKIHAIDVFKKRIKLLDDNIQNPLKIKSSEDGTTINFCLKV